MNRDEIMAAARAMADTGNGLMAVFVGKMDGMRTSDPARYDSLMAVMEAKSFSSPDELRAYVCE